MLQEFHGGCRCASIRYTLSLKRLPLTYACHCLDCQTWTGTAFSQQAVVPSEALTVVGAPAIYELISGPRVSSQRACGVCHTRIFNTNLARPGVTLIRAGTLDQSDELSVAAHIWVRRKQARIAIPLGTPIWDEGAPLDQLAEALDQPA